MDNAVDRLLFFEESKGDSKLSSAQLLAAETVMMVGPWYIGVEPDPMPYDGDEHYSGPVWTVTLYSVQNSATPKILASMGGVVDGPRGRVVAAELAYDEILHGEG
jgi:hypothetical protein